MVLPQATPDEIAWRGFISAALPPVILISAGGLLVNSANSLLTSVVLRMRTIQGQVLNSLAASSPSSAVPSASSASSSSSHSEDSNLKEDFSQKDLLALQARQLQILGARARRLRTIYILYVAGICSILLNMLFSGISLLTHNARGISQITTAFFICGIILDLTGFILSYYDVSHVMEPISEESDFIAHKARLILNRNRKSVGPQTPQQISIDDSQKDT